MNKSKKIVVFDLDETLGYFTEFGMFCDCLDIYYKDSTYSNIHFKTLLDLYPEFLRPHITDILTYIKTKKKSRKCYKVMIYTNNNGPKSWAKNISDYFDTKVNYKLFDQIIAAFKIRGEKIELGRTTHEKTIDDLFRCTKLPENVEICFIDDLYHDGMADDSVYYINVKPYHHELKIDDLIKRYLDSKLGKNIKGNHDFVSSIKNEFKKYNNIISEKSIEEQEIDDIIGKKMFQHIKQFFYDNNNNKTFKRRERKRNKTKRNKMKTK